MKIAFIGKMCSGKTYCCNYLMGLNDKFYKTSFAKMVKYISIELFDMKDKDRILLQNVGFHMRAINKDVFANYVIKETKEHKFCLVDDLRYKNELEKLKSNNWIIVKLYISREKQIERLKTTYPLTYHTHIERIDHNSECDLDDYKGYDYFIDVENMDVNGNLEKIYKSYIR